MNWASAFFGAFLACAAIFGLTSAALWPMMRRAFLGWAVARMVALTTMILALSGFAPAILPLGAADALLLGAIAADISLACCGPLLANYAEARVHAPRARRQLQLMLPLTLVPLALLPAVIYADRLDWLHDLMLIGLVCLLAFNMAVLAHKGSRNAAFQCAAWTPGLTLALIAIGHELFVGGMMPYYVEAMTGALLIEFVVTAAGLVDGFLVIKHERDRAMADVDAAHAANATDPLTQIANRRGLDQHFHQAGLARPDGIALLDCDHFKRINDRFGHDMGDRVLVAVAQALSGESVFEARLGGEEFVLLLYGNDWQHRGESARRRITQQVRDCVPGLPFPVSASAGLAAVQPGETLAEVMKRADRALYAAKEAGRNRSLALTEFRSVGDALTVAA